MHVHEIALGDKTGMTRFHLNVGEQTNSLLDNVTQSSFGQVQVHLAEVRVKAMTRDNWAEKFEPQGMLLLKADIQSAERLLVIGRKKTSAERVAAFYTEICILPQYESQATFCEMNRIMVDQLGFALYDTYPCQKVVRGGAAGVHRRKVGKAISAATGGVKWMPAQRCARCPMVARADCYAPQVIDVGVFADCALGAHFQFPWIVTVAEL